MKKHISKNGQGKITSKITKPKDWAFRTPFEGRAKSVHSRRCKPIKMNHVFWKGRVVKYYLMDAKVGTVMCHNDVSCENPARKLNAQDVLNLYHQIGDTEEIELKYNVEKGIAIFVDLTNYLTGGHDEQAQEAIVACERLDKDLKRERNKRK